MAVQVGGACYDTPEAGAMAAASAHLGEVVANASGLYSLGVVGTSATSIEYSMTPLDGGPSIPSVVVPFAAIPCNLLDWSDGLMLGWGVILAFALAFGVKFLGRQFRGY